jgi:putative redox protein
VAWIAADGTGRPGRRVRTTASGYAAIVARATRLPVPAQTPRAPEVLVKHVTVTWDPQRGTFQAVGARPDQPIEMAAPTEDHSPRAISPAETLLAAVGGCSAWDVVEILRKQRQPVTGVQLRVEGRQLDEAPWAFTRVRITYVVCGRGMDPAAVERAVQLSTDKYCSVIATIRGVASVESEIELIEQSEPGEGCDPVAAGRQEA